MGGLPCQALVNSGGLSAGLASTKSTHHPNHGLAVGFGVWQWVKMDRMLKKTRAERAAKEAAEQDGEGPAA